MTTPTQESKNLPALFREGRLLLDADCFDLSDEADTLIEKNGVKTRDQLLALIMLVRSFGNRATIKPLLVAGIKRQLLTKMDLLTLYTRQTPEARIRGELVTLTDLWDIPIHAFPKEESDTTLPLDWFRREDLILIAEEVLEVNHTDLVTFFQHWFYGGAQPVLIGKKFLEYWYEKTGETHGGDVDGKIASLIAIALFEKHPDVVDLDGVLARFRNLSMRKPDSHGTYRYLSLAFAIAGKNKAKRKKALDAWVQRIIEMICSGSSLFRGAQMSIELLIRERGISKGDKVEALQKIDKVAQDVAKSYTTLIRDAQNVVDTL
jgi:hypothetical protein